MAEDLIAFGTWVRLRRQALVLTREELASRVGCAEVTIRKIEADERKPSPQVAELLAQHLGLPTDQHDLFVRVARGMLAVAHLPPPILGAPASSPPIQSAAVLAPLPRGTVTFLFTDIESSTRQWEQQPDAMRQALVHHNTILRATIESQGGYVFKTVGDSFCAAFAAAPDALAAAIAGQRVLASEDWGVIGPIRVRMALHTGTAEPQAGDYFGQPLNRVARLLSAGHGGQILVSLAAHELVRDHLPEGASLRDLGRHRLKDLVRPEPIFQVNVPDLPADFPSLNSLDARSSNLPAQVNALIGRTREVADVVELLSRARLVTLSGPGGTGKTRLALQIGSELLDQYADGVWFVDLAPVVDGMQVAQAVATALGIGETPEQPIAAMLKSRLQWKRMLILLDNCEQIVDAVADLVDDLLRAAPHIAVLATSRTSLRLSSEHEYSVPPLAIPRSSSIGWEHLLHYDAVALFMTRARAIQQTFALTNQNAPAVAEICVRLDGLPLAIELAVARLKLFTPEQLLQRLNETVLLHLTGGARDLPIRQRTMRAAIEWSYRLLNSAEQQIFPRLGVFVSGWTIAALEQIGRPAELGLDAADVLAALVEQNLVRRLETDGEPRFALFETIREYALERLAELGETEQIQQRHAEYFVALAENIHPEVAWPPDITAIIAFDREVENLRTVLRWALESPGSGTTDPFQKPAALGLQLILSLHLYWDIRAGRKEGHQWLEALYAQADDLPLLLRIKGAFALGELRKFYDAPGAQSLIRSIEPLVVQVGDQHLQIWFHCCAGWIEWFCEAHERAEQYWTIGLELARTQGDARWEAEFLTDLGEAARSLRQFERSQQLLHEGLQLSRVIGYQYQIGESLFWLTLLMRDIGNQYQSYLFACECVEVARQAGNRRTHAIALEAMGYRLLEQGHLREGEETLREACDIARIQGNTNVMARTTCHIGRLRFYEGDLAQAEALMYESEVFVRHDTRPVCQFERQLIFGLIHAARGTIRQAAQCYRASLMVAQSESYQYGVAVVIEAVAGIAARCGNVPQAIRWWGAADVLREVYTSNLWSLDHFAPELSGVAAARAQINPVQWKAAWAAGRTLIWQQAADEALEWLQDIQVSA